MSKIGQQQPFVASKKHDYCKGVTLQVNDPIAVRTLEPDGLKQAAEITPVLIDSGRDHDCD